MKRIIKLAVYGIAISAFVSCQKDEPQKTQSWPEWFETSTPFNKNFVDVLFFAGTNIETEFDKGVTVSFNSAASREDIWYDIYANTHYCINPVNSPRWPEHNLHVYEVRMYAPYLRKNIKDRAYRSVH